MVKSNKNNGFTLIELLAVIVILAIILVVAVPSVLKVINGATKGSFESDAKMLLKQIDLEKMRSDNFDPTTIDTTTLTNYNLSNTNYAYLKVDIVNDEPYLFVTGKNKWNGFKACGDFENISVVPINDTGVCNILNFNYSGNYQSFIVPTSGNYKFQLWGASAQTRENGIGGKGGYTEGTISLTKNEVLYIYVGEGGQTVTSAPNRIYSFNGGGYQGTNTTFAARGGSATDVRLVNGNWDNANGLISRIMVAGAGGNGYNYGNGGTGGYAGGLTGIAGQTSIFGVPEMSIEGGRGATQIAGGNGGEGTAVGHGPGLPGSFGKGGICNSTYGGGGGSGYYGGGGGGANSGRGGGGGGGSSFISGYTGCDAVNITGVHTGQPNHYSGKVFTNAVMIAGNASMSNPIGGTEIGHSGNGYARITYISQ